MDCLLEIYWRNMAIRAPCGGDEFVYRPKTMWTGANKSCIRSYVVDLVLKEYLVFLIENKCCSAGKNEDCYQEGQAATKCMQ